MKKPVVVNELESLTELKKQEPYFFWMIRCVYVERFSLDELHHDVPCLFLRNAVVEDLWKTRMIEASQNSVLVFEAFDIGGTSPRMLEGLERLVLLSGWG